MTDDEELLNKDDPQQLRALFNRSPHPYHHIGSEARKRFASDRTEESKSLYPQDIALESSEFLSQNASFISATSASDSGTEADDEKPLLKALTAPPVRSRKGMKDSVAVDGATHLLSVSSGPDEGRNRSLTRHASIERRRSRNNGLDKVRVPKSSPNGLETTRRLFEVVLFAMVGWISLLDVDDQARATLWIHTATVLGVYTVYILWLVIQLYLSKGRKWTKLWLPASADPAPLIYPVFLPLLVTYSLDARQEDKLISYVLSISAIPRYTVPFRDPSVHWLLSLLPLLHQDLPIKSSVTTSMNREETILLFPLHTALMQVLYFLTTTSLLDSELQLFSIALINLLGVPKTPQSSILKALLWIGGLGMLLSCRHILKLSVELARVPTWRLKRVKRPRNNRSILYCALDDTLGGFLSRRVFISKSTDTSDEEDSYANPRLQKSTVKDKWVHRPIRESAVDDLQYLMHSSTFTKGIEQFNGIIKLRRHTFSGNTTALPDIPTITRTATNALSSAKIRSKLILKLTLPQATVLKWIYATSVYLATVLIILIPVRLYVQHFALNGHEPVGWALGYLLGDYQPFRFFVVMQSLDSWICLPSRDIEKLDYFGMIEYFRHIFIGVANTRLIICLYCLVLIACGLAIVNHLSNVVEVDTRRKVFHGMMVVMFLPTIFVDPAFIALAFTLILAVFLLLDLFRASQLPPLSKPLTYFLAPYVDGRDHKGPIVISHIFLLIGCAVPLWLSLAAMKRTGSEPFTGWELPMRDLSMVTGIICVGMGDAAASLIGRRFGRRRWPWSGGKSLEGSAAFAFSVFIGLAASREWLIFGEWRGVSDDSWRVFSFKATMAATGASLTEAVLTGGNDNVVVPIILWLLTRGMAI